jgi:hypothetical protein
MAIDYDPQEYIAALGNIGSALNDKNNQGFGVVDNLNNVGSGKGSYWGQVANILNQQQAPQLGPDDFGSYVIPPSDPTFSTGQQYARSIASGGNIPGMIAPGVSYSPEQPGGYTQAQLNTTLGTTPTGPTVIQEPDDRGFLGIGIGGARIPVDRKQDLPPRDIFSLLNIGKLFDGTFDFSNFDFGTNPDLPPDIQETIPVIPPKPPSIGGVGGRDIEDRMLIDERIEMPPTPKEQLFIDDMPRFIDEELFDPKELIQGPVDMPMPPKIDDQLFIDDMPGFDDIPSKEYVVPQVPLNNLLNQIPPQGPVGMSPQETAKMSSQQELSNLIDNKDILQEIPADDGVRNQYQVELDEFINKSPINMDTYKEELPVGSAINLGIPSIMETVVPMAVPGLGLAKNISNSFQNDFSPSPSPSPQPSPTPSVPSFTPGIDYSNIYKFGR